MRAYHAHPGTTDAHPPCVKRALSGIGIALLLLPVLSFEALYSAWAGEEQLAHRLVRGGEVGVGELPDHLIA